jgi:hypothetical protein
MRKVSGAVAALAVCLVLTGCQDDGQDPSGKETPSGSSSTEETPTGAPAADGPLVEGDSFSVHVPQGWKFDKTFSTDFIDQYSNPDEFDQRLYVGELSGDVRPLEEVAKGNFARFATTSTDKKQLSGGDIAGQPAYHFVASQGADTVVEEFGVVREGHQVTLNITLTGSRSERQAVIDSVLASWEWK